MKRRTFVQVSSVAGAGLLVGFAFPGARRWARTAVLRPGPFRPNGWITLHADGRVTLMVDEMEMGQGVTTSVPMILADELDVAWEDVDVEYGPEDPSSWERGISTGGSTTVRTGWEPLREAAATARTLLMTAAAARWGLDGGWHAVKTEPGHVVNPATGDRIAYGDLLEDAAALPVPEDVLFKSPEDFRIIGTPTRRLDTPPKVDGSQEYGLDVRLPDMLHATVARCPVFGGSCRDFDATEARDLPGVRDVFEIDAGVAVVADDTWSAIKAREALEVQWDESPGEGVDTEAVRREMERLSRQGEAAVARDDGDVGRGLRRAARRVEATYHVPYLAHACMEPMNCTAHVRDDGVEVWAPTQSASGTQRTAAEVAGVEPAQVVVHSIPMGGGFGRRSNTDFVAEAVAISARVGRPVKVTWTREDDTQDGYYRPAAHHRFEAGLGSDGMPVAWSHRVVAPSILYQLRPAILDRSDGVDGDAVGGAEDLAYAIPDIRVDYVRPDIGVPLWWWRSVGHSHNAFTTESFVDELAHAAGTDPVELRRRLLAERPRLLGVLELAVEKAGWGSPLPGGRARGVAVHPSFGSYAAHVAEVSLENGRPRVHRVVAAVDCGRVINPDTVRAQTESAIVYGLTAALYGDLTLEGGRVVEGNFNDYPVLRMREMPHVETHIVESAEEPGGIGELNTPPIAPAVANALFALTGRRVRRLPMGDRFRG